MEVKKSNIKIDLDELQEPFLNTSLINDTSKINDYSMNDPSFNQISMNKYCSNDSMNKYNCNDSE